MVDFIVGPKPSQRFTVHEGLLRSNLREYAFERLVEEAEDGHKCIVLEDHSPASFKIYANWLYRRRIPIPVQAVMTSSEEDFIQDEYVELARRTVWAPSYQTLISWMRSRTHSWCGHSPRTPKNGTGPPVPRQLTSLKAPAVFGL